MSDPKRLLDRQLHEGLADLLRSAQEDMPPSAEEKKRRIHTAARAPLRSALTASSTSLRNVAWIGIAAVIAAIGGASMLRESHSAGNAPGPAERPASIADRVESPAPSPRIAEAPPVAIPSLRVDELPAAPSSVARSPSTVASSTSSSTAAPERREAAEEGEEDELKNIYAAQSALTAKRPALTLEWIARYRSTFRAPRFSGEADALEVQALMALGRREEATTKAQHFLAKHPDSPYAQRVRSAAGRSGRADEH